MVHLKKITLGYVEVEDRVRMSAEHEDEGGPLVLWLTFRFCRMLVKALCRQIEKSPSSQIAFDRDTLLSFRQRDAEGQLQPSAPVRFVPDGRMAVPERVSLSFSSEGVVLRFFSGSQALAFMSMSQTELLQWLGLLHKMFKKAGWPLDSWPKWFTLSDHSRN